MDGDGKERKLRECDCGSDNLDVKSRRYSKDGLDHNLYWVTCCVCLERGPMAGTAKDAEKAWGFLAAKNF